MSTRSIAAALAVTTLAVGAAFAADHPGTAAPALPPGHAAVVKDFGTLSADGTRGYRDLGLARLTIYDGRTADAKKFVDEASSSFDKAKNDESVFTAAEATVRSHMAHGTTHPPVAASGDHADAPGKTVGKTPAKAEDANGEVGVRQADDRQSDTANKPMAWLPVFGTVSIDEDYTMQPAKAKAVADANQSLATGDRKGAMDKLALADIDRSVTLAVLPLQQTIADVDSARQLIDAGKYFEGSQKLRLVQDSTVLTILDVPVTGQGKAAEMAKPHGTAPASAPH